MKKPLLRFMLVSDMHYSVEEKDIAEVSSLPNVNVSYAAGSAFGYTQKEKIDKITEAAAAENSALSLNALLVLGDLSIDDYDFRNLPLNYCERFKRECMDILPCPSYAIAGNHDSHPNSEWQRIFGYDRQFSVEFGDTAFIMLDTFNNVAKSASGAAYTPVDMAFLKKKLEDHKGKRIFLCAHHFDLIKDSEDFYSTVRESKDIVALFRGHTHCPEIIKTDLLGNKPLIDIGGYAYKGVELPDGRYTFLVFDESIAWGYQIVEMYENRCVIYHHTPAIDYKGENGSFSVEEKISAKIEITL